MTRQTVREGSIQLEAAVAMEGESIPMSTGGFARRLGHPARVVRVMRPDWALAHKLAAWNERRLARDLYDCYFLATRLTVTPAEGVLDERLARVESRIPDLIRRRSMSRNELGAELRSELPRLTQERLEAELGGVLPSEEIAGLALRIRAATVKIAEWLEGAEP